MPAIETGNWRAVADLMLESARRLAAIGAAFLICPDNTIHQALPLVLQRSPLRWLSIAEEVVAAARAAGRKHLAVLGTQYLMEGPVYREALSRAGLAMQIPDQPERLRINQIIFSELVCGRIRTESRAYFNQVMARMKSAGCDAAVLGCTEIPLLVDPATAPLPVLDSTRLLARAALREALA
jgi:aspartate racemase